MNKQEEREQTTIQTTENEDNKTASAELSINPEADGQPVKTEEEKKRLRKQTLMQTIKFVCFSASAGAIQLGASTLFWEVFHWDYWTGYLIALIMSVIWNFTFNRKFTFKSANNVPIAMLKVLAYYAVFTPCSTLWGDALTKVWTFAGADYIILIGTMLINMITEFLFQRFIVFGKSINSAEKDKTANKGATDNNDADNGATDTDNSALTDNAATDSAVDTATEDNNDTVTENSENNDVTAQEEPQNAAADEETNTETDGADKPSDGE